MIIMIAIKDIEMPASCEDCHCTYDRWDGETRCCLGSSYIDWTKRPLDCPLVEVNIDEADNTKEN